MGYLYRHNLPLKKQKRLNYIAPSIWRVLYLIELNPINKMREKRIYSRSSIVPPLYLRSEIIVYSGKKWVRRYVNRWMIGHKFGEFTWNRKYALYKAKQIRKKKKKNKK